MTTNITNIISNVRNEVEDSSRSIITKSLKSSAQTLAGSHPHQPEVWVWDHQQRQEGPESLRDGEDAAQQ